MNDVELIKSNKFADNDWRAAAIATGCRLWECATEDEKLARVRLYRDWRNSKIYGKDTKLCFEHACRGEAVPVVEMFEKCAHETAIVLESFGAVEKHQCTWACGKIYWTVRDGIITREVTEEEAREVISYVKFIADNENIPFTDDTPVSDAENDAAFRESGL